MLQMQSSQSKNRLSVRVAAAAVALLSLWVLSYLATEPFAEWITYEAFGIERESKIGAAVEFFFYDTTKILLLLVLMVYLIALVRAGLNVERVRSYLTGKSRWTGYVLASGFGAVTPFCSCSSVPLFIGFTVGGIPLGITMAFLITSPIINEVAVVLLWGLLGWKMTTLYVLIGLAAGIVGGLFMDKIGADRWLQPFLLQARERGVPAAASCAHDGERLGLRDRHEFAVEETKGIVKRVWIWVIVGVGLGALLHGFVPQTWIVDHLSSENIWSVPAAVILGIPLYTNVTGIIPVMESLLLKGLPLGTTLAFCMSTVAASLPEVLMLKQVMRARLIAVFLATLVVLFTIVGWMLNALSF